MRVLFASLLAAVALLGQPAPKFPTATATWQDLLVAKPAAKGTLSDAITAEATAIPVSDGSYYVAFSAVQIQEEVILICSVDGNALNVCPGGRGFSGTAAAPHGIGSAVRNTITTHHHNQLAAEVKAIQEALGPNLSNVASSWDNISGKPTTFLFSDQSYTDPAWLTITKGKVGLASVENTALSTWPGSTAITTLGTIATGTVPWARLTGQPATWAPSAHTHGTSELTDLSTWGGSTAITTLGTIANGTVPWARLSSVPSAFAPSAHSHAVGDLSTVGDYSSNITSGTYSINITGSAGSAGSVTNGVYTTGSYSDPSWLTISKTKVGLGNVENTALSTWAGSANITTLGTISSGTVPWARLSGVPGTFTPSAHSHAVGDLSTVGDYSSKITSGTYSINVTGSAGSAASASAVPWSGVSSKPAWNSDPATFVGGTWTMAWKNYGTNHVIFDASQSTAPNGAAVNNTNSGTAWSATYPTLMGWNGSSTYGVRVDSARVADGVAWTGVSGRPTALSQFTNDSGFQTSSGSVNYATSAGGVAWGGVSSKPAAAANITGNGWVRAYDVGCGASYNAASCDAGGNGYIDYTDSAGWATGAGNADTVDSLHAHTGTNNEANKLVRTDGNGYAMFTYINSNTGQENGTVTDFLTIQNSDGYYRKAGLDWASKKIFNARTLDASWMWQDDYIALPTGTLQWGVFTPRAANAYIQSVVCWADTGDAVIQLRRNDGGDMINGNLGCNGSASTNLNGYRDIPVGYYVGMWAVSGSAKSIRAAITYTVSY